jgi:adenylylsulfate kinase
LSQGGIVWITGIPASGKSTIAGLLATKIRMRGGKAEILDGDEVRQTISKGLGWSREDRRENVCRISWAARTMARNDIWVIVAAVSPYKADRDEARADAEREGLYFQEVHTQCPVSVAKLRDQKELYKKTKEVTGVDAPYEESDKAFVVDTHNDSAYDAVYRIFDVIMWHPEDNPPVICIGRGHGGTRLVSKMMQDFGIFIGQNEQVNGCEDSIEWVNLIYRMVVEGGPTAEFQDGRPYKDQIRNTARLILQGSPIPPGAPWGWKLPETTLVMPAFAEAFPKAKFIHCLRHPVSSSLRNTHLTSDPKSHVGPSTVNGAYAYCGRALSEINSDPEWMRSACTWAHQVGRAVKFGRQLGPDRYLELKYEDICAGTDWAYGVMERFLKLRRARRRPSMDIEPTRMNRWHADDPRAQKIWEICRQTAELVQYKFLEGSKAPKGQVS